MDVSIITAQTIEAFIKYIELNENHKNGTIARRLTETINRRATLANRKVSEGAYLNEDDLEREWLYHSFLLS